MSRPSLANLQGQIEDYVLGLIRATGKPVPDAPDTLDLIESNVFDSLSLIDFVMHVERLAGIKIPGEDIVPDNFGSVRGILRYLREDHGFQ